MTRIDAVFIGRVAPLPPDGQPSGIVKQAVTGAVAVGPLGLAGDNQADLRVHGGPDKAVHHYPAEHYAVLRERFPAPVVSFVAGSIGENLSTHGWTEENVCVGDIFRVGTACLQVTQGRSPCWKIDSRYGLEGVMQFIVARGITGWYCRVIESGHIAAGDAFTLIERNADPVTLQYLWRVMCSPHPPLEELSRLAWLPGLSAGWAAKLRLRLQALRQGGGR